MNPTEPIGDSKIIFVVGNSRSGTTMMGRILGLHPQVFTFGELHFFDQMWGPREQEKIISLEDVRSALGRLFTIQRDGYWTPGVNPQYQKDIAAILLKFPAAQWKVKDVYKAFLEYETSIHRKIISCEQTPGYLYYLDDLLEQYPSARVIVMVRDGRDVLLSQRDRWRRRQLSGGKIPAREALRVWANYSPITMSLLWKSGIREGDKFRGHPRVLHLQFEKLVFDPHRELEKVCKFLNLNYYPEMLSVPQVGSSSESDRPSQTGINVKAAYRWKTQTGTSVLADLAICQWLTKDVLQLLEYPLNTFRFNRIQAGARFFVWPVKMALSFLFNIGRNRNLADYITRRLGGVLKWLQK
jgi:omega-hydroxy-beta-dihydromenaquinone-9 sulfotransferase